MGESTSLFDGPRHNQTDAYCGFRLRCTHKPGEPKSPTRRSFNPRPPHLRPGPVRVQPWTPGQPWDWEAEQHWRDRYVAGQARHVRLSLRGGGAA
jgi:hypothetical protein